MRDISIQLCAEKMPHSPPKLHNGNRKRGGGEAGGRVLSRRCPRNPGLLLGHQAGNNSGIDFPREGDKKLIY